MHILLIIVFGPILLLLAVMTVIGAIKGTVEVGSRVASTNITPTVVLVLAGLSFIILSSIFDGAIGEALFITITFFTVPLIMASWDMPKKPSKEELGTNRTKSKEELEEDESNTRLGYATMAIILFLLGAVLPSSVTSDKRTTLTHKQITTMDKLRNSRPGRNHYATECKIVDGKVVSSTLWLSKAYQYIDYPGVLAFGGYTLDGKIVETYTLNGVVDARYYKDSKEYCDDIDNLNWKTRRKKK